MVTGGARGLGYEFCKAFLDSGCTDLAILDLKEDEAQAAAEELIKAACGQYHSFHSPLRLHPRLHHPPTLSDVSELLLIRCEVDSEMEPSDYRVMGVGCDVSSELSVQQAFRRVMDTYGRIDSVVASAGASSPSPCRYLFRRSSARSRYC